LWLNSIKAITDEKVLVGLFREESAEELASADPELLFSLARHTWIPKVLPGAVYHVS